MFFHVVLDGTCWLTTKTITKQLLPGDIVLLPHGSGHKLTEPEHAKTLPLSAWRMRKDPAGHMLVGNDAVAPTVRLMCGSYSFDSTDSHPLLRVLPAVICISIHPNGGNEEIPATLGQLAREYHRNDVGSSTVVSRLLDVLFIEVMRACPWKPGIGKIEIGC